MPNVPGKPLWQSKTLWINVVAVAGIVLTGLGIVADPEWVKYEAIALAVLNVVLRLLTGQPITGIIVAPEIPEEPAGAVPVAPKTEAPFSVIRPDQGGPVVDVRPVKPEGDSGTTT